MPRTYGPYPERGAARGAANCADVRERLHATRPVTARAADVVVEHADLQAGLVVLLRLMDPARLAAGHPVLLAAA